MDRIRYFNFGKNEDLVLLISRILIVLLFIIFGIPKLMDISETIKYMTFINTPFPTVFAIVAIFIEVFVTTLIIVGFYTRPLAVLLALYTITTAVLGHHYWTLSGEAIKPNMINFYKNISIAGAFILLSISGPGKMSFDKK